MYYWFYECANMTEFNPENLDTSHVTTMDHTFYGCEGLEELDLTSLDVSRVGSLYWTFYKCSSLKTLNVSGWDTGTVINMDSTFYGCSSLGTLDLSTWDTRNVANMNYIFYGCSGLYTLDLTGWDTARVKEMRTPFSGCTRLGTVFVSPSFTTKNIATQYELDNFFYGCWVLTGMNGTSYYKNRLESEINANKIQYARIDYGNGYFSLKDAVTVRLHANYSADGDREKTSERRIAPGSDYSLSSYAFSRIGHSLLGWSLSPDGPVDYEKSQLPLTLNPEENLDLYAQWEPISLRVAFLDDDSKEGAMESIPFRYGEEVTIPECTINPPEGFVFDGWTAHLWSGNQTWHPGDIVTPNENANLTPIWKEAG